MWPQEHWLSSLAVHLDEGGLAFLLRLPFRCRPWDSQACWWEPSWAACREEVRGPYTASLSSEAPFFLLFVFMD